MSGKRLPVGIDIVMSNETPPISITTFVADLAFIVPWIELIM